MPTATKERRSSPRVQVALDCTLRRRTGSDIHGRTVDLGTGGMCLQTERPVAEDEVLTFDLETPDETMIHGHARVLRQQGYRQYALRFERLAEPELQRLQVLTTTPGRA